MIINVFEISIHILYIICLKIRMMGKAQLNQGLCPILVRILHTLNIFFLRIR